jgi:hypothetical protein
MIAALLLIWGCATGNFGKLQRVDTPTISQLRNSYGDYTVYYKQGAAVVFDIPDQKTITVPKDWVLVGNGTVASDIQIWHSLNPVSAILGTDGSLYGYVVYARRDIVSVVQIDERTLRLFYQPARRGGR